MGYVQVKIRLCLLIVCLLVASVLFSCQKKPAEKSFGIADMPVPASFTETTFTELAVTHSELVDFKWEVEHDSGRVDIESLRRLVQDDKVEVLEPECGFFFGGMPYKDLHQFYTSRDFTNFRDDYFGELDEQTGIYKDYLVRLKPGKLMGGVWLLSDGDKSIIYLRGARE